MSHIVSKAATDAYRNGWEDVFGKPACKHTEGVVYDAKNLSWRCYMCGKYLTAEETKALCHK